MFHAFAVTLGIILGLLFIPMLFGLFWLACRLWYVIAVAVIVVIILTH